MLGLHLVSVTQYGRFAIRIEQDKIELVTPHTIFISVVIGGHVGDALRTVTRTTIGRRTMGPTCSSNLLAAWWIWFMNVCVHLPTSE